MDREEKETETEGERKDNERKYKLLYRNCPQTRRAKVGGAARKAATPAIAEDVNSRPLSMGLDAVG